MPEEASAVENVRVAVRVRPFVAKEKVEHQTACLRVHAPERQVVIGKDRGFSFDFVFGEDSTQAQVYEEACLPLVRGCMEGYNATVFAYGQVRTATAIVHLPGCCCSPFSALPHRRLAAARRTRWAAAASPTSRHRSVA